MEGLNWPWIALAAAAPPIAGLIAASLFWRTGQMTFGSIVGTAVIFGCAIAFILREHVELDRLAQQCLDAGEICWPVPGAFARFAIYAFIALAEVCGLFMLGLRVDERVRRRGYAPEWQRR
jgi:hypothetical protein